MSPVLTELIDTFDSDRDVWRMWLPTRVPHCLDWIRQHVFMPEGQPFDLDLYPHIGAPRGPAEAFDDLYIRTIWLMWGVRLGKTALGHSLGLFCAATQPAPMMFGTSTAVIAKRNTVKLWKMYERCRPLVDQMPPRHRRGTERVDFRDAHILIAYAGSPSTTADASAWYLHINETDKHTTQQGPEGDSVGLLRKRTHEFPDRKELIEGTPTRVGSSRLDAGMKASDYRRFWVPCPKCGTFQLLQRGPKSPPGSKPHPGSLTWDHLPDGHSDPTLAYETARYICIKCERELHDEHRARMMARGQWAPEGCWIDKRGNLKGTPKRQGPDAGFQLSTFYSLRVGWGDLAKWFVESKRPRQVQDYINSIEGLPYERVARLQTWEMVAQRLGSELPSGICPPGTIFVAAGIDRQEDHYVYMVVAYGEQGRGWLIDWGFAVGEDEVQALTEKTYRCADGQAEKYARLVLIDSGDATHHVYGLCAKLNKPTVGRFVVPVKGVDTGDMAGQPYKRARLAGDIQTVKKAGLKEVYYYQHPRKYWEEAVQSMLDTLTPAGPDGLMLTEPAMHDRDLIEQLLNAAYDDEKGNWDKAHEDHPDDFRAALRYCRMAAEIVVRNNWSTIRYVPPVGVPPKTAPKSSQWLQRKGVR